MSPSLSVSDHLVYFSPDLLSPDLQVESECVNIFILRVALSLFPLLKWHFPHLPRPFRFLDGFPPPRIGPISDDFPGSAAVSA